MELSTATTASSLGDSDRIPALVGGNPRALLGTVLARVGVANTFTENQTINARLLLTAATGSYAQTITNTTAGGSGLLLTTNTSAFGTPSMQLTDGTRSCCITPTANGFEIGTFSAHDVILRRGQTERLRLTSSGISVTGDTLFATGFAAQIIGSDPYLSFDANDYFTYNRTSNVLNFQIGATPKLTLGTGSLTIAGAILPSVDDTHDLGSASFRWDDIYATNTTIQTSDEREKEQVGAMPDAWLDAWADVEWVRYKWISAVAAKNDDARWHTGLIAQRVRDAFAAHDLDAFAIGLLCYDEWEETPAVEEVRDENDNVLVPASAAIPAGNRYGLRYGECFAIEAAYQRRRMAAIEARLAALENA